MQIQVGDVIQETEMRESLHRDLVEQLEKALNQALIVVGAGFAWQGVRDDVFEFARLRFDPDFTSAQRASFLDYVDKGGCAGTQRALVKFLKSEAFHMEATSRISSGAADDIVQMVLGVSQYQIWPLSEEAIQKAVAKGLEGILHETFIETTGAMSGALVPIKYLITTFLEGLLKVPTDGKGAQNTVDFIISEMGAEHIKQQCLTITDGFSEFLDATKIWIAGCICVQLAHAAMGDGRDPEVATIDWNWICAIVELVREGVMPMDKISGRVGEVAGLRMLYWLREALECRTAWGSMPDNGDSEGYDFRNQKQ